MGHPAEIRPTSKSGIPELEASKVRSSFPGSSDDKASAYNAGNLGSIPESGRSPGLGNGNPLQYSCLENSMDRGACWAIVHEAAKSWACLSTHIPSSR